MPRKQIPVLMRSGLTGSIWIVTRYREDAAGPYEALEKYDVTDQFDAILEEVRAEQFDGNA